MFLFLFSLFSTSLQNTGCIQQEIADAVVRAGYEQKYSPDAVGLRINREFAKLQKLVFSQFESDKPISDIVKENEKYYGLDETYNKWTRNVREEHDKEIQSQIISEYLKAELTQKQISIKLKEIEEKFEILEAFRPVLYNIWGKMGDDDKGLKLLSPISNEFECYGNIPVEFVENLLYYYTELFDVVYDPFAGGGITILMLAGNGLGSIMYQMENRWICER